MNKCNYCLGTIVGVTCVSNVTKVQICRHCISACVAVIAQYDRTKGYTFLKKAGTK